MSMSSNPSTVTQGQGTFITPAKTITHLGSYIEPTTGKLVDVHYDQTNHVINHDLSSGAAAPTVLFAAYADYYQGRRGKNLVHLGSFQSVKGIAQGWYDPLANTTLIDTVTV